MPQISHPAIAGVGLAKMICTGSAMTIQNSGTCVLVDKNGIHFLVSSLHPSLKFPFLGPEWFLLS